MNTLNLFLFMMCMGLVQQAPAQHTTPIPKLFFMEPDAIRRPDGLTNYHIVTDAGRLGNVQKWLGNPWARWALITYSMAVSSSGKSPSDNKPTYYIALSKSETPSGIGFNIQGGNWVEPHPNQAYVILSESPGAFESQFLEETGRLVLKILRGGKSLPDSKMKLCLEEPNSPDRAAAFESGFVSHLRQAPNLLKNASDSSKTSIYQGTANQLLLSGEFHESFFLFMLSRDGKYLLPDSVEQRLKRSVNVVAKVMSAKKINADTPLLIDFVSHYVQTYPGESPPILDRLSEMSGWAFFKQQTDRGQMHNNVAKNPAVLYEMVGPQIRCEIPSKKMCFDVNTAGIETIKLIPGITSGEVEGFMKQRTNAPFKNAKEFRSRSGFGKRTMKQLKL